MGVRGGVPIGREKDTGTRGTRKGTVPYYCVESKALRREGEGRVHEFIVLSFYSKTNIICKGVTPKYVRQHFWK